MIRQRLDTPLLYSKLKYKYLLSEKILRDNHGKAIEFLEKKGLKPGKIREHATKLLTSGVLAGALLLTTPLMPPPLPATIPLITEAKINQNFSEKLANLLPKKVGPLTEDVETEISHLLYKIFGINAVAKLGSTKLNDSYGLIGAEQHLPRFPGDTISQHDEYQKAGITPGLGGWGYFAYSKNALTQDLIQKEKYYVAVQTLYLPDWNTRTKYLVNFYKHRKVVVVNPINGKTIVCVIADAGPAKWTGKVFGGSPEVMAYLGLNVGMQKGPVVLFFIDDTDNKVPLGPLEKNVYDESLANR